jgi:hypothetical protein
MSLPHHWPKLRVEIDALLRSYYPDYEERIYLKPVYYVSGIQHDPGLYPLLSDLPVKFQKRYISLFLKEQGRVPRNENVLCANTWMLPGAAI